MRDLSEEDAIHTFNSSLPYKSFILGIGLDSNEIDNPPEKFKNVYKLAKDNGYRLVAHAGEESFIPTDYVKNTIDVLNVERIDHGIQVYKDEEVIKVLVERQIPLTICPLSNDKLQGFPNLVNYPFRQLMDKKVLVTINSDDPAYFGGYIGENYLRIGKLFNFSIEDYTLVAKNSFRAAFLNNEEKEEYYKSVDNFMNKIKK